MKKPSLILLATFSVGFAANNTLNAAEGMLAASVHNVSKKFRFVQSTKDDKENKSTKDFVKVLLITAPLCIFTFSLIAIVNKQLKLKSKETSEKSSEEKQQEVNKEQESEDNKEIVQKSNKKENNAIKQIFVKSLAILPLIFFIYVICYQFLKTKLKNKLLKYRVKESGINLLFNYLDNFFSYLGGISSLRILFRFNKLTRLLKYEEKGIVNFAKILNELDENGLAGFAKILHGLDDRGLTNLVAAFNFKNFILVKFTERINSLKSEEDVNKFANNINNYYLFLLDFISEENFHDNEKYHKNLNILNDIENDLINYDELERQKEKYDKKLYNFYEAIRNTNEEDIKAENFKIETEHESFLKVGNLENDLDKYIEKNKENKYKFEDLINNTDDWGKVIYL